MADFVSIIIPTFNEAKNIPVLLPRIAEAMKKTHYKYEIIVSDDDSPDKTWAVAKSLRKQYPVVVLRRTKNRGLSPAVIDGFKIAKGDIIGVMDADLSHPPEVLPRILHHITHGYDMVIGSRLVKGGRVEEWPWYRKVISDGARLMARPLTSVVDIMSGYFFVRRDMLKIKRLKARGYKIGLDIIVKCGIKKVKEVPIVFRNRNVGHSKLTWKVHLDYLMHLLSLYKYVIFDKK